MVLGSKLVASTVVTFLLKFPSMLPDTVFEAVLRIPYDMQLKQVLANGKKGRVECGCCSYFA
jgi:hypothetical protein